MTDSMPDNQASISPMLLHSQVLNALVVLTSIHAQDFQDIEGDSAEGRETLPILYPAASRMSMIVLLPGWSLFLSCFWDVSAAVAVPFILLGSFVGVQYFINKASLSARDHQTYRVYNVRASFEPFLELTNIRSRSGFAAFM